jgi:hypothetical protein
MQRRPVPTTREELLSPEWLTAALSPRFPGVEVVKATPGDVMDRVTTNVRFTIECAGERPDGLPAALCAKGYFSEAGRAVAPLGAREVYFYREMVADTGLRTLRPIYAEVDPETRCGILLTEDVIVGGARFLDATCPYTPDQAALSLAELARLHAYGWEREERPRLRWLRALLPMYLDHRGAGEIRGNFDGPLGVNVPAEVADPERLVAAFRSIAASRPEMGPTIIHGDPHIGNVYLAPDGRPSMVDWQCVQAGDWAVDVGYHIAASLAPADRESSERDLLAHYLDELRARGVDAPGLDLAQKQIRKGMVYGFFMWAITLHVAPVIVQTLLERLGAAVAANDGLAAVGA